MSLNSSTPPDGLPSCPEHLSSKQVDGVSLPFTVLYQEGVGRYVVASRDIKANEVSAQLVKLQQNKIVY